MDLCNPARTVEPGRVLVQSVFRGNAQVCFIPLNLLVAGRDGYSESIDLDIGRHVRRSVVARTRQLHGSQFISWEIKHLR